MSLKYSPKFNQKQHLFVTQKKSTTTTVIAQSPESGFLSAAAIKRLHNQAVEEELATPVKNQQTDYTF